jgi:hypothetical protein
MWVTISLLEEKESPMYVSISTFPIQSGQMDEAIRIHGDVLPLVMQLPGIQNDTLLVDRSANTIVTIATYDTLEHAQVVPSGALREAMAGLVAVLSGQPDRKWYEVVKVTPAE